MDIGNDEFYWCETPATNAIFETKAEAFESVKQKVNNTDNVDIWHLQKISDENFHWEKVPLEELMDEALKD
jgi:hypothetical protein